MTIKINNKIKLIIIIIDFYSRASNKKCFVRVVMMTFNNRIHNTGKESVGANRDTHTRLPQYHTKSPFPLCAV